MQQNEHNEELTDKEKKIAMERLRRDVLHYIRLQRIIVRYLFILTLIVVIFMVWMATHPAPTTIKTLQEISKLHSQMDSERVLLNTRTEYQIRSQQIVLDELTELNKNDSIRKNIIDSFMYIETPKK